MDGNRQTRSEKEIAKRNRVLEGRCVLQHVTTKFCNIDFSNKKIFKEKMSLFCRFFSLSPHILPYTYRGQTTWRTRNGVSFSSRRQEKTAEGAPNILGTPSWTVFRKDERQKNREFILCWLMENCEVFAISFLSIKKRKLESSCLVVAKIRSVTSKKRNICYAGGFCRGNEDATQKKRTHPL